MTPSGPVCDSGALGAPAQLSGLSHLAASPAAAPNQMTLLVFSGDYDKLMAALMVATGAAASGQKVSIFFSFWGVLALKRQTRYSGKNWIARLMTACLPSGPARLPTSRLNFFGAGPRMFGALMKQRNIPALPELLTVARELDVKLIVCPMSMEMLGIAREELIEGLEVAGVASFVACSSLSQTTLVF